MLIKTIGALLLTIGTIAEVFAAPSLLALCHKDVDCDAVETIWEHENVIKTGWIEKTFSNQCLCGDRLLSNKKPKIVRIHLMNGPCMRNKRCGRYEPFWGYNKASANRAVKVDNSRLMRRFKAVLNTTANRLNNVDDLICFISPCLECDLNASSRATLLNLVFSALPYCIPVDNPHQQTCIKNYTCERHGQNPVVSAPCIVDLDGKDGSKIDVKKWVDRYKHCVLTYYWEPWMNCIEDTFKDPRKRRCNFSSNLITKTKEILCQYFWHPLSDIC